MCNVQQVSCRRQPCPLTDAPFALPRKHSYSDPSSGGDRVHSPQFPKSMLARHKKTFGPNLGLC